MNSDVLSSHSGGLTGRDMVTVTPGRVDVSVQFRSAEGPDPGDGVIIELNTDERRNGTSCCEQGQVKHRVTMSGAVRDPLTAPIQGSGDGGRSRPTRPRCTQEPGDSRRRRASAEAILMRFTPDRQPGIHAHGGEQPS